MPAFANYEFAPIIILMARGWESKSIEEQQAEAATERTSRKSRLTPEQANLTRKVEGLRLSRQRVLQQIQNAHDSRLRQMLERALADLDREIAAVKSPL
jgi:hypothetical protein